MMRVYRIEGLEEGCERNSHLNSNEIYIMHDGLILEDRAKGVIVFELKVE